MAKVQEHDGRQPGASAPSTQGAVFVMAGGGTGGHVIPTLAVAARLRAAGHRPVFIGTRKGIEARLVPAAGFPIEWIEIGGLKGKGAPGLLRLLWQLPLSVWRSLRLLGRIRPAAIFSLGGYVAGPVMLAALLRRIPVVVMEPNAMPGLTSRALGRFLHKALVSFPETVPYFPPGVAEVSGLPVREEFFAITPTPHGEKLRVLVTGGSQGSRRLNEAARESWAIFERENTPVRMVLQCGPAMEADLQRSFAATGLEGRVVSFIDDMAAAFAEADLVVSRSGAGAVAELAAAGKPSLLVPYPYAADNHQWKNAEAMQRAGAAKLIADHECTGARLAAEITHYVRHPEELVRMAAAARRMARPRAAERAVEILESLAGAEGRPRAGENRIDTGRKARNNIINKCF